MCAGAFEKKEQKFDAKSADVTSMMLIMAFIGTLTTTLFYQIYGNVSWQAFELKSDAVSTSLYLYRLPQRFWWEWCP